MRPSSPPLQEVDIEMNVTLDSFRFRLQIEQTIVLLNQKLAPVQVTQLASVFRTLVWTFPDVDIQLFLIVDVVQCELRIASNADDEPLMHLVMDSLVLRSAAYGQASLAQAFLCGRLKVKGANPMQLMKFMVLVQPFLESYRQASEDLDGTG